MQLNPLYKIVDSGEITGLPGIKPEADPNPLTDPIGLV